MSELAKLKAEERAIHEKVVRLEIKEKERLRKEVVASFQKYAQKVPWGIEISKSDDSMALVSWCDDVVEQGHRIEMERALGLTKNGSYIRLPNYGKFPRIINGPLLVKDGLCLRISFSSYYPNLLTFIQENNLTVVATSPSLDFLNEKINALQQIKFILEEAKGIKNV